MKESILNKIPNQEVKTEFEKIMLYRLGVFENAMYELVELQKDEYYKPHKHKNSEAKLHIILGKGLIILDGKEIKFKPGDSFEVGKGMSHGFKIENQTLLLSIQKPPIIDQNSGEVDLEYI
jgi:quercetin dioxygenase-like cupin family protein